MTKDLLIFDGDCGFCTRSVEWGRQRGFLSDNAIPFQRIDPSDFGLSAADVESSVWLVSDPDDLQPGSSPRDPLGGSDAIAALLVASRPPYTIVGRVMDLPLISGLARSCYRVVAKNRHRVPASTCSINDRA